MRSLLALAVAGAIASTAHADLAGTEISVSLNHAGAFGPMSAINNHAWSYGSPDVVAVPNWGMLHLVSPVVVAGYDNAVTLDFTMFAYSAFTGAFATTGTLKLEGIDEPVDLGSVHVLLNGVSVGTPAIAATDGFSVGWSTQTVFNANPVNPGVTVAWNASAVPGPGALALLGMAGVVAGGRRRRPA